jgi:hypothetical protein
MWKGLIRPWRDRLPLREQRVRHLIYSDWLEEIGAYEEAQIVREGRWCIYFDSEWSKYALDYYDGTDPVAPLLLHFWPRSQDGKKVFMIADLDDALLDSDLWTIIEPTP